MKRLILALGLLLALAGLSVAQTATPPADTGSTPALTAEQQSQLDNLKQLEQQLQKDRAAVHAAITQYGVDSDKTDAALQQLHNTRMQYRQTRRSLQRAGVPVPPPVGLRAGGGPGRGGAAWQGGYGYGRGFAGRGCRCPCWRW